MGGQRGQRNRVRVRKKEGKMDSWRELECERVGLGMEKRKRERRGGGGM